ncbi:hypothetical protein D6C99_07693 [Aureobasidium pullulans]|nr:hypothetical protein D6C99_07693 [Aureobasidium pullulans]
MRLALFAPAKNRSESSSLVLALSPEQQLAIASSATLRSLNIHPEQVLSPVAERLDEDHFFALELNQKLAREEEEASTKQEADDRRLAMAMQEEEDTRRAAEAQPQTRECVVCSTKVAANDRGRIYCPQCIILLNHDDVRRACDHTTFAEYDKHAVLNVVSRMVNFNWCLRAGCDGGQEQDGKTLGYMKCHSCDYAQCLHHRMRWHTGETCKQYDERTNNRHNEKTEEMINNSLLTAHEVRMAVYLGKGKKASEGQEIRGT